MSLNSMKEEERRIKEEYLANYFLSEWVRKASAGVDAEASRKIKARTRRDIADAVERRLSDGKRLGRATRLALQELEDPKKKNEEYRATYPLHVKLLDESERDTLRWIEWCLRGKDAGPEQDRSEYHPMRLAFVTAAFVVLLAVGLGESWIESAVNGLLLGTFLCIALIAARLLFVKCLREYADSLEESDTPPPVLTALLPVSPWFLFPLAVLLTALAFFSSEAPGSLTIQVPFFVMGQFLCLGAGWHSVKLARLLKRAAKDERVLAMVRDALKDAGPEEPVS